MNGSTCHFCGKRFRNAQAVRAHLKACPAYRQMPKATLPNIGSTSKGPSVRARPLTTGRTLDPGPTDEGPRPQRARPASQPGIEPHERVLHRMTIQSLKNQVVNSWWSAGYTIPSETRAQALVAIEQELSRLPTDQLPRSELIAIAEG